MNDVEPIDVWLRFDDENDETATYEANTFRNPGGTFRIEWYHNDVGQVTTVDLDTYDECVAWYETNGYRNFTA